MLILDAVNMSLRHTNNSQERTIFCHFWAYIAFMDRKQWLYHGYSEEWGYHPVLLEGCHCRDDTMQLVDCCFWRSKDVQITSYSSIINIKMISHSFIRIGQCKERKITFAPNTTDVKSRFLSPVVRFSQRICLLIDWSLSIVHLCTLCVRGLLYMSPFGLSHGDMMANDAISWWNAVGGEISIPWTTFLRASIGKEHAWRPTHK